MFFLLLTFLLAARSVPAHSTDDAGASNLGRVYNELLESLKNFKHAVVGNSTATRGARGEAFSRWTLQDELEVGEVCSWPGITCIRDKIVQLELQGMGLQGSLKDTVKALQAPAFSSLQLL